MAASSSDDLRAGVRAFCRWRNDAIPLLDAAIAAAPERAMAHAAKGLILAGGRNRRYDAVVARCLDAARSGRCDPGEAAYVDALGALVGGDNQAAVVALETHLATNPTDLFAHRLAQQELFWMGEARWMRDVASRAMPAWSPSHDDYSGFLSVYAFSHEEAGELAVAERAAREAVERDPTDCWGTHAVAHVMEMQDRHDEGVAWLEGLQGNWEGANQIVHHLWWHLCLFHLENRAHDRVLELLDTAVRNPEDPLVQAVPDAYIDIQNVAALLLRLELRGVDVGARWETVADVAADRIDNHPSPFTSAHAAMILAAAGRMQEADRLVESLATFAAEDQGSLGPRVRVAAWPAARAAVAHRRGDHECVVASLMPARHDLWRMGGSHAQRDVFYQILADSLRALGRRTELGILLHEIGAIGFTNPTGRTFYRDIAAFAQVG
ncbi:MAG: hypothetical protein H6982_15680 [Chromatiales bacterium]|nr:hypothetical protein [Chromatiales bacterium]